jgi:hypothetical protein
VPAILPSFSSKSVTAKNPPRINSSRPFTTSSAASPPRKWRTRPPVTHSSPPRSSTKCGCASAAISSPRGPIARISSARPPSRCAASSSKTPAANAPSATAAIYAKVSANETGFDLAAPTESDDELLLLNEALDAFAAHDARKAELVKQKYFVGLTLEEAADVLGISHRTAKRDWAYARAWLFNEVKRLRG